MKAPSVVANVEALGGASLTAHPLERSVSDGA